MNIRYSNFWGTIILIFVFFLALYFVAYINFAELYLPSRQRESEFVLKNFLIYNFSLKLIYYPLKFFIITLLLLTGSFILNVKHPKFIAVFKIAIIAEFVNLITDSLRIVWFTIYPEKLNALAYDNFIQVLSPYLSLVPNPSIFYSLLLNISTYEILYIAILTYLTKVEFSLSFFKAFFVSGFMYLIASIMWTMVTVLIFI